MMCLLLLLELMYSNNSNVFSAPHNFVLHAWKVLFQKQYIYAEYDFIVIEVGEVF